MKRRLAAALLSSLTFTALAQQPAPSNAGDVTHSGSAYNLKVTTTIVSLDVVVTDSKGNPVDGLKKDDFSIIDNKQPQMIRSFEAPESHFFPKDVVINSTAELDKKTPAAPVTIIVLDEANTKFEDEAFARYSIQKYLKTQPDHLTQPTELVAIDITHFMVLRDYTTSKQEILNALNHHLAVLPWHLTAGWESEQFAQSFMALEQVAKAVAGHPGHKNMIWIGKGMPTLDLENMDSVDEETLENAIQTCTNMLRDSRITLYTVDPAGLAVSDGGEDLDGMDIDADPFGSSVDFNAMAKATGGVAFFGRNDVDNLIGKSVTDGNNFYTMTYRPGTNDSPNPFRAIHVVVNKPGLTVTTREGYYVKPANAPPVVETAKQVNDETGNDLMAASENQMVYDGLAIEVKKDDKDPQKFIIHVPALGVDWQHEADGPATADISLLVATFDHKGHLIKRDAKVVKVHGKAQNSDGTTAPDPSINLATEVDTSKAVRIRFVVRSGTTGKIGAQNVPCTNGSCTPM
jgi:VWFA-related protein